MENNIISHPRLIEMKERELEEYERQIEIKRTELYREYQIFSLKSRDFENTRKRHVLEIFLAFVTGVICGVTTLMLF
jgi:trehalose/maltose hydrolase-like predicted phosphorylase